MTDEPAITVGGRTITSASGRPKRITMLLWGSAGTGKTTLASTAPGRKLIYSFDPDGTSSVSGYEGVSVLDYTGPSVADINSFKLAHSPLNVAEVIEHYDTIIVDSLTNVGYHALQRGIKTVSGATIERPSPGAYQVRNALVLQLVKNMLAITAQYGKHLIFIAHEDEPVKTEEGVVMYITLSLGGKLPEQTALDFNEVWCLQDPGSGRNRRILIRPARHRKPLKTRMFSTTGEPEFEWVFNPDTCQGMTIAHWFEQWEAGGGKKLALPQSARISKKEKAA